MLFWYIFWLIFQFLPFLCARRTNYSSVVSSSDIFLSASRVSIVSSWLFSWDSHVTPFSMANGQYISFPAVEGLQYFCGCPQNVRVLMSYFKAETWLYSTFMVELVTRHDRSLGCGNLITSFFFTIALIKQSQAWLHTIRRNKRAVQLNGQVYNRPLTTWIMLKWSP